MKRLVGAGSDQLRSPEYCITTSLCSASTLDDEDGGDEDIEYVDIEYEDIQCIDIGCEDIEYGGDIGGFKDPCWDLLMTWQMRAKPT